MKVFLGWSGDLSHKVAVAIHDWLPNVIQAVKPFVSSEDIAKGARWSGDIAKELQASSYGIICVTKDNSQSPWINFEAGALSKEIEKSNVSPFLFDLRPSEIQGPLSQFMFVLNDKGEIFKLLSGINDRLEVEQRLEKDVLKKAFEVWWPHLKEELAKIESEQVVKPKSERRTEVEMLEELLDLIKVQEREQWTLLESDALARVASTEQQNYRFEQLTTSVNALARSVEALHTELDTSRGLAQPPLRTLTLKSLLKAPPPPPIGLRRIVVAANEGTPSSTKGLDKDLPPPPSLEPPPSLKPKK